MRLNLIKLIVLANFILVAACGGDDNSPPINEPDFTDPSQSGGVPSNVGNDNIINGISFNWPDEFTVADGQETNQWNFDSNDVQPGRTISTSDNTMLCSDSFEAGGSFSISTVNAQVVSANVGDIISVESTSADGFSGQEVLLSISDSNGDFTRIARHYYLPKDRLNNTTGHSAVFRHSCTSTAANYAQNEAVLRSILNSVIFSFTP